MDFSNADKSGFSFTISGLPKSKIFEVDLDRRIQPRRFLLLLAPLRAESLHFVGKGFAIVLGDFGADVSARGEYMAVLADFFQHRRLAEAGDVLVGLWIPAFARMTVKIFTAPEVVGIGDLLNIGTAEFAPGAVHQRVHVAGVDEQHLAAS